jgi:hypothetical protein
MLQASGAFRSRGASKGNFRGREKPEPMLQLAESSKRIRSFAAEACGFGLAMIAAATPGQEIYQARDTVCDHLHKKLQGKSFNRL